MAALPAWNLLKGKTAAITGGTTGIGRAIALAYIAQGCNVAVNHLGLPQDEVHRHSLLEEAKAIKNKAIKTGDILELPGDVTNPETGTNLIKEAESQWGKLDIFVANAGVFKQAEFLKSVEYKMTGSKAFRSFPRRKEPNALIYLGSSHPFLITVSMSTSRAASIPAKPPLARW